MGQKLNDFYERANKLGQLKAKMRLAVLTRIPSKKAMELPDSPENIKLFMSAMKEIEKEFK